MIQVAMSNTVLSMRERMRLDALYVRVRKGDHYEVLGVQHDAAEAVIVREHARLHAFLKELLGPDRELGEHQARAEAVAHAVDNAGRILGNARERMRYDAQQAPSSPPPARSDPPQGARRATARRVRADAALPAHLQTMLEATLGVILRRDVDLTAFAGGSLDLRDPAPAQRAAEDAERESRWFDAAVWWHLAALADPSETAPLLRAASAMRRGGVPSSFERYQQAVGRGEAAAAEGEPRSPSRGRGS